MEDSNAVKKIGVVLGVFLLLALVIGIITADRSVTVTYDWGYDDRVESETQNKGVVDTPQSPYRFGYEFEGWFVRDQSGNEMLWDFEQNEIKKNTVFYAKWKPKQYQLTMYPKGGEGGVNTMTVTFGQPYTLPEIQRKGYYFAGWYVNGEPLKEEGVWWQNQDMALEAGWTTYPLGMTVTIGSYEQNNDETDGKEPIEWLVLDYRDGRYLLISRYILDAAAMTENIGREAWETCALRLWLNQDFLNTAFTEHEQKFLITTQLTDTGTTDTVFFLNHQEVESLAFTKEHVQGIGTPYAKAQGLKLDNGEPPIYAWWWLRHRNNRRFELAEGFFFAELGSGRECLYGVRPAIWLDENALLE